MGQLDPLFGVAAWTGREKHGNRPWTDDEFYALGGDWDDFDSHWQRYGRGDGCCLEIGCGAGRITRRLAAAFREVIAVDVSEGMISYARQRITDPNVRWFVSDGERLPCSDGQVSAVFSTHVFQHLPNVEVGAALFSEIYRVLEPGGSFMVHLPLLQLPEVNRIFARLGRYALRQYAALASANAAIMRLKMRLGGKPHMHGTAYEVTKFYSRLVAIGFQDVEFATFLVRPSLALQGYVMGKRHG